MESRSFPFSCDEAGRFAERRAAQTTANREKLKVIDKTAPAGAELPVTSLNTILANPSVAMTTTTDYVGNIIYENGTLKRILTSEGYWQDGTYYYFLKDHLGSNRVVINGSGTVVESSSYYPSGMRFGESAVNGGSVQPYRHTGLEMQEMHGLNWIDNNARFRTVSDGGGFTGVDPHAEKYYSISPYAYCMGNPVNAIDPDGRLVIFINGNHYGDGGKSKYWNGFDTKVMNRVSDHNSIYKDGSLGGWAPVNMPSEGKRESSGYEQGKIDASYIISNITNDKGEITQTIKIISHSMGGAYAKGYVKAILEYAHSIGITIPIIAFEADFAPFEATKQKAVKDPLMGPTYQFNNKNDKIANNENLGSPSGTEQGAKPTTDNDPNKGHSISDFQNQIQNLPAGRYRVENGQIVPLN